MRSPAFRAVRNAVVDSPPELLAKYEVTTELQFIPASATSNIDLGAIHAAENIWGIGLWFKPNSLFSSASSTDQYLFGQYVDATNYMVTEGGSQEIVVSAETSWTPERHFVICSAHNVNGKRMIVDGGTAVTEAGDTTAISLIANQVIGCRDNGTSTEGFDGSIDNVAMVIDALTVGEEADLLNGIVPVDATDYWRLNEGTGTSAYSREGTKTVGTIDTACTWGGTGAQTTITLSPIPAGYGILILIWENSLTNNPDAGGLEVNFNGDEAANYDRSRVNFGTASSTTNADSDIPFGLSGDIDAAGFITSGYLIILNRAAQEKVAIGKDISYNYAHDFTGKHTEAKWRNTSDEISSMVISSNAGSLIGGSKFYLLGIKTP